MLLKMLVRESIEPPDYLLGPISVMQVDVEDDDSVDTVLEVGFYVRRGSGS